MTGGLGRIADSDTGVITKLVASDNFAYVKNLEGVSSVLALHRIGHPLPESEDCVLSKVHMERRYCRLGDTHAWPSFERGRKVWAVPSPHV